MLINSRTLLLRGEAILSTTAVVFFEMAQSITKDLRWLLKKCGILAEFRERIAYNTRTFSREYSFPWESMDVCAPF